METQTERGMYREGLTARDGEEQIEGQIEGETGRDREKHIAGWTAKDKQKDRERLT